MDEYRIEPINKLPIKRLFDHKQGKLKEFTKLPKEFELTGNEILLKIKLIGINYLKDFELLKNFQRDIVPGNKFIGKIYAINENCENLKDYENLEFNCKYLVFPFTNCIQQNFEPYCHNCNKFIVTGDLLPCLLNFEYGINLNGGFQDYLKIANFSQIAVKIPENISNHDVLFMLDIMLPFYSCIKSFFKNNTKGNDNDETFKSFNEFGKKIIILNDSNKELNDILIIIKLLKLNEDNITIIDFNTLQHLNDQQLENYYGQYNQVFLFNFNLISINFAFKSLISTGLTSTKSRYHIFLFNQYNPSSNFNTFDFYDYELNDKTLVQFKLNWFNKIELNEILSFLSILNNSMQTKDPNEKERSNSSSNCSVFSDSTFVKVGYPSPTFPSPSMPSSSFSSDNDNNSKTEEPPKKKHHWLWYEKDFDLTSGLEKVSNQVDKNHSIKQINKLIQINKLSRICYNNKPVKSKKLNAFVFS